MWPTNFKSCSNILSHKLKFRKHKFFMSKSSYFQDFLLKDQFPVPVWPGVRASGQEFPSREFNSLFGLPLCAFMEFNVQPPSVPYSYSLIDDRTIAQYLCHVWSAKFGCDILLSHNLSRNLRLTRWDLGAHSFSMYDIRHLSHSWCRSVRISKVNVKRPTRVMKLVMK